MFCPYCGHGIADNATICPSCNGLVSEAIMASSYQNELGKHSRANYAQQPDPRDYDSAELGNVKLEDFNKPRRFKWRYPVIGVIVLALLLFLVVPLAQEAISSTKDMHRVTFLLKTTGYNDDATAIPVQVTGTNSSGFVYDELVFLDGGGNGVVLEPGQYTLTFPGGSFLSNGKVLLAPEDAKLEVTVPEGLARNEFVQVPTKDAITYTVVSPIDVTDEQLNTVYEYAAKNPADHGKANTLRADIESKREQAKSEKAESDASVEKEASGDLKVSVGDEAKFIGTFDIISAEDAAEKLDDQSIYWNMAGQTLAVLWLDEERTVTVESTTSSDYSYNYYYYDQNTGQTTTSSQEYQVKCLVFNTDVEGVYTAADDGTLTAYDGKRVLVTGRVNLTSDWESSLLTPITLSSPEFEVR